MQSRSVVRNILLVAFFMLGSRVESALRAETPNIVLIYADDLGYGDLGCHGGTARTPHSDRLAREGLDMTDGHSSSATCTPSRYALLTGEYPWRKKGTGVLPGDAALIIPPGTPTLPSMLQSAGYRSTVIGKWHLGLGRGNLDWNGPIRPGPMELGFTECFLMPATGDRVPCVYVKNDRVFRLDPKDPIRVSFQGPLDDGPTGKTHPEMLTMRPSHGHDQTIINGISRIGYMTGGRAAQWDDKTMADEFVREATEFLERQTKAQPWFLMFSTHDIHVPRVPHPRFAGLTKMGPRGDAILQFDACVGAILKTLDRIGATDNTLVILTSDNGPVIDDGYQDDAVKKLGDHHPTGGWRGGKYSAFEGGTRVPFLIRWPARIRPGKSSALVGQLDIIRSLATLVGAKLPPNAAPDARDVLPAFLGTDPIGRDHLVEQAGVLSLRFGPWKYIAPGRGPRMQKNTNTETGQNPEAQLYHLGDDPGETENRARREPEQTQKLQAMLQRIQTQGTPAP